MPATSPPVRSSTSTAKPFLSQYLMYMRSSIAAQSCASVPPEPASKSKIPPQLGRPGLQVGERGGDLVYALGFHFLPPSLAQAATGQTRRAEYSSAILSSKNAPGLGAAMNWR